MPQNISSIEDIASAALFKSQTEQNGEPFPTHVLPSPVAINKKVLATCNSWSMESQLQSRQRSIPSGEEINWVMDAADCLPYRTGANHRVHGLDEKLGPQVPPNFGRKGIARGTEFVLQVLLPSSSSSDFFLPLHCFVFLVCHYLDCC